MFFVCLSTARTPVVCFSTFQLICKIGTPDTAAVDSNRLHESLIEKVNFSSSRRGKMGPGG